MKITFKILFFLLTITFSLYLLIPNRTFPDPPEDAVQSKEPGDTETPSRRAYFTNYTREEVINHYRDRLKQSRFGFNLINLRLNYPPEDAQSLIRDQTRSTFLEEIVIPFRESLYINGFEPKDAKDQIIIDGTTWRQKITVKLVTSQVNFRLIIGLLTVLFGYLSIKEWFTTFKNKQ